MFVTKKHLHRRTFLRGMGATLALPLLDGMIPALTAIAQTAGARVPRFGVIYLPDGVGGANLQNWTPAAEGAGFEFTSILEPLSPFRNQVVVLSGLSNAEADPKPGEGAGDHARGPACFLTCVHAKKTEGPDLQAGVSMDQIIAQAIGRDTQLTSLELGLESVELLGACDPGYSCAYSATVAWRTPTTPLPMENDPRAVFDRLFGGSDTTDTAARMAKAARDRSLLDSVSQDVARLGRSLGARDRAKLSEYLEGVRDVERRIQRAEEQAAIELPVVDRPASVPSSFSEHAKLMFDLLTLALQTDLTRVFSFMMAREFTARAFPESGVADPHHTLSHHQNDPEKVAKYSKVNAFHMKTFAYLLEKLRTTPEGDGSLLDQSMIMVGAGISNGDRHSHDNLPIVLVGGGAGRLTGGRHVRYPKDTPLANLHLAVLNKYGARADKFGDSTGMVDL